MKNFFLAPLLAFCLLILTSFNVNNKQRSLTINQKFPLISVLDGGYDDGFDDGFKDGANGKSPKSSDRQRSTGYDDGYEDGYEVGYINKTPLTKNNF